MKSVGIALLSLAATPSAFAQGPGPDATVTKAKNEHAVAVTISPIHLIIPVVEITGEYRAFPKMGIAGILGGGKVDDVSAYEVGGQFNYYLLGSFDHGMQLGLEAVYLRADTAEAGASAAANALAVGPYVGYKIAMRVGFTFNAQLGVQAAALRAKSSSSTATATADDKEVFPLVNVNVGWSF